MDWVLDSSLALAWALPDETSGEAERFMRRLPRGSLLWAPVLWWYEVANALAMAQRRKRIKEAEAARLEGLFGQLPLRTDAYSGAEALLRYHTLAREHGLSAYDCVYLELAQRRGLGLATLDKRLWAAARTAGIQTP